MQRKIGRQPLHVMVLATMSAGKSTFINSLIGTELLHSGNEATTSSVATVESLPANGKSLVTCFAADQSIVATRNHVCANDLRAWNADHRVKRIQIRVPFAGSQTYPDGLVLHDTPGPNNSQDAVHAELALDTLRNTSVHTICYLLNASQLGINDDKELLGRLKLELINKPQTQVLFILNKVDLLDEERHESVESLLRSANAYLEKNGFPGPRIIPTMSQLALLIKKRIRGDGLSFKENSILQRNLDAVCLDLPSPPPEVGLPEVLTRTTIKDQKRIDVNNQKKMQLLLLRSGIPTVEAIFHNINRR